MSVPRPTTLRLGIRLARRELWRRPARSTLVVLLVLVPALVMTGVVSYLRTTEYTRAEFAAARYGRADVYAEAGGAGASLDDLRAGLPPRTSVVEERSLEDRVRDGDRRAYFSITDLPVDDPIVEGRYGSVRGRLPATPREAVISDEIADDLDVGIGDSIRPERLGRSLRVVGIVRVRLPGYVAGEGAIRESDGLVSVFGSLPTSEHVRSTVWIDVPGRRPSATTGQDLMGLRSGTGWDVYPIDAYTEADQTSGVFWAYLGGAVGLMVLATIITAAFAVGARRQLTTLGLLSSTGASPTTIKWFLVAQGAVLGALGSIGGVVAGVSLVRFTPQRLLDAMNELHVDHVVTRPLDLLPIVLLGTVVAAAAAWLPARSAAKVPTLQALAGRRPLGRVPRRLPILGGVSILVGCGLFGVSIATLTSGGASGLVLLPIAGSMAVLFGAIAISPWVIERIEHGSARLPETWRLAGRSLGRSRVRSSAVVGAVCAVTIAVVGGTTIYTSLDSGPDECCEISEQQRNRVTVETFAAGRSLPASDEILERVREVVPRATVVRRSDLAGPVAETNPLPLEVEPSRIAVLQLPGELTDRQRRDLELLEDDVRWEMGDAGPAFFIGLPSDNFEVSPAYVKAIILAVSMLFILGVVAIGLALAARDSEDEGQVLAAVGAGPKTLRRIGALRGMLLTLTAAVIAVPAALVASAVIVAGSESIRVFRVDWWAVVFVVAVVPLVVGAVALGGARLRDAIRPARPDVFALTE